MTHIVQSGETLWSIASRYGVSPQAIMRANGITNPNAIFVGQRLFIPIGPGQPGPQPFPPFPPVGRDLERRVNRLEQEVNRLQNEVNRLDRRIDRLER